MSNDDLLLVPWLAGGRNPHVGLDCVGLVMVVAGRKGLPLAEPGDAIARAQSLGWEVHVDDVPAAWRPIPLSEVGEVGDLLVLEDRITHVASHLAIVETPGVVMHSVRGAGCIRTPLDRVRPRVRHAYRWTPGAAA